MICLETALAAKFDETIVEALGEHAPRPERFEGLEKLPQRVTRHEARCAIREGVHLAAGVGGLDATPGAG